MLNTVNTVLREGRTLKGLKQTQVAEAVGISPITYQRYEAGERTPDAITAHKIVRVVGVEFEKAFPIPKENR